MAGGGFPDIFGALGGGLQALAGGASGGGGGSSGGPIPDFSSPANAPNTSFTDPTVNAPAALTAGDPTGQGRQEPVQLPEAQTFTQAPPKDQDRLPGGGVNWTSPANLGATGGPPPAQQQQWPSATSPLTPGISPETKTGLTPQAEVAAGYRPPEATDADLAQAAEEQARKQGAGGTDQAAIGASSINTDQQGGQQGSQKSNPLQTAGNMLKRVADRTPGPGATHGQSGGGGFNLVKALGDLITQGPGAFAQDLQGLTNQVGGAYGPQDYNSQGGARGYGYGDTQAPQTTSAPPAAPGTPPATDATGAVRAGYDQAAAGEQHGQQRPPMVLIDPNNPSKGYMPDPNASSASGGPPTDNPSPGDPKTSANYIAQHGGYSEKGYERNRGAYGGFKLNPEMTNRLASAGQEYERQTGRQPEYGLGDRDSETQRYFWEDSRHGTRYAAAPPGQSLHQQGLAMDMPASSGFTQWLRTGNNAQRFGLGFPVPNDPYHVQMQDLHNRAYPYTPSPIEANFHNHPATGGQASLEATGGTIPGSQSPAGTRPADPLYNPRSYAQATFNIESSGNPNARTGSNRGLGQFGPAEEREFGITPQNRNNPQAQERALQLETERNTGILRNRLGREPTQAELYLTHQQGQAGGPALLSADPNTPAWQAISHYYRSPEIAKRAIIGNLPKHDPLRARGDNITAGEFVNWWKNRFERETGPQTPGATTGSIQLPQQLAQREMRPSLGRLAREREPAPEPPSRQFNQPFHRGRRPWWQDQPSEDQGNISGGRRG